MFYGPGAGEKPTASSIISDIADLTQDIIFNNGKDTYRRTIKPAKEVKLVPVEEIFNRFYLRFFTRDVPGVLAKISGVLAENNISISSMIQLETHGKDNYVPIVLLTHKASEKSMKKALQEIIRFEFVKENYLRLRIF
jgi:homoserine dehydrogenase